MVAERVAWRDHLAQVKRMDGWLCEVEAILAKEVARTLAEPVSKERVERCLDTWRTQMAYLRETSPLSEREQESLRELLQVRANLRPSLVPCSDRADVSIVLPTKLTGAIISEIARNSNWRSSCSESI